MNRMRALAMVSIGINLLCAGLNIIGAQRLHTALAQLPPRCVQGAIMAPGERCMIIITIPAVDPAPGPPRWGFEPANHSHAQRNTEWLADRPTQ